MWEGARSANRFDDRSGRVLGIALSEAPCKNRSVHLFYIWGKRFDLKRWMSVSASWWVVADCIWCRRGSCRVLCSSPHPVLPPLGKGRGWLAGFVVLVGRVL
jgi:hypothetical protein